MLRLYHMYTDLKYCMNFQRFAPPEPLRSYVHYFWTLDCPDAATGPHTFRLVADGCPGLVFQQAAPAGIRDQNDQAWPTLLLHGQTTRAGAMQAAGPFRLVGACLRPHALPALFHLPAAELTDSCLDASLLGTASQHVAHRLLQDETGASRVQQLAAFLLAALSANRPQSDTAIEHAVSTIITSQGQVPLPWLRDSLQVSERSFQRRFKHAVGVSPLLFARICQFQASLGQLRTADYEKLSDLAFAHDYADQSHHIRAFKEFAGVSPRQYLRQAQAALAGFPAML